MPRLSRMPNTSHISQTPTVTPNNGSGSVHPLGKIEVLPNAIHTLAVRAISECYGVVGIASPRLHRGQAVLLGQEQLNQGVQMRIADDQIILDVYVVLEYGLRISEIAHNVMSGVKFAIEKMLGVPVAQVNVHVQGLSQSANS